MRPDPELTVLPTSQTPGQGSPGGSAPSGSGPSGSGPGGSGPGGSGPGEPALQRHGANAPLTPISISPTQIAAIRTIPHLAAGSYSGLDIAATLEFYRHRYVEPLRSFRQIDTDTVIADVGAGYGWLAMAFALASPARMIAIEMDGPRLAAGREIATILGVADRIEWRTEALGTIGLPDHSADVVYCIEVLEHVYGDKAALSDLARLSRDVLVVTTPNKWFPVIAHDTRLPLCHLLPLGLRQRYAALFNRQHCENDNLFWSATALSRALGDYRVQSGFLHYRGLDDYLATYPFYLPYNGGMRIERIGAAKLAFYRFAALFGGRSRYLMPNLATLYRRHLHVS